MNMLCLCKRERERKSVHVLPKTPKHAGSPTLRPVMGLFTSLCNFPSFLLNQFSFSSFSCCERKAEPLVYIGFDFNISCQRSFNNTDETQTDEGQTLHQRAHPMYTLT